MKDIAWKTLKWAAIAALVILVFAKYQDSTEDGKLILGIGFGLWAVIWQTYKEVARLLESVHRRLDVLDGRINALEIVAQETRAAARMTSDSVEDMAEHLSKSK